MAGGVYISPNSFSYLYDSLVILLETIIFMYPNSTIIISDDFKLPEMWDNGNEDLIYFCSTTVVAPCIPECFIVNYFRKK